MVQKKGPRKMCEPATDVKGLPLVDGGQYEIPVIDLFAGPGGLGEGFASAGFDVVLSCEKDLTACNTLLLRKFYHLFEKCNVPEEYYQFIKGEISLDDLKSEWPDEFKKSLSRVMQVELGDASTRREVHQNIRSALADNPNKDNFVLIGGPPCQAYSLAGRSRRIGLGKEHALDPNGNRIAYEKMEMPDQEKADARAEQFYQDPKHRLYLEYLEIIAVHKPAVFIMENVKGMTSARRSHKDEQGGTVFEKVMHDLRSPGEAVNQKLPEDLKSEFGFDLESRYRLVSMSKDDADDLLGKSSLSGKDFIVRCEDYGVPQARHRVFIVGIREDISGKPVTLSPRTEKVTVGQMIGDLPKLRSGLSKELDNSENWAKAIRREYSSLLKGHVTEGLFLSDLVGEIGKLSASLTRGSHFVSNCDGPELQACSTLVAPKIPDVMKWVSDERLNGFIGHSTRGHMASDLARYLFCAAYAQNSNKKKSPKLEDWSSVDLLPDHANVRGETDNFGEVKIKVETHSDRFRVQVWDSPSTTVVSHISKDGHYFIHPDPIQCRSLTVREAARLQTFPDNYFFSGERTAQYHQVGNAVPPYLAKQIAERIFQFLDVSYSSVDSKMCIEQERYDSSLSDG
jgi:DNA (cytosine-5)-methyltransferase 1